jgi:hypothetical protein
MEVRTGAPGQLEHFGAYAGATWLVAVSVTDRHVRWLGLLYIVLAAVLELGQLYVPGRTSQVIDFAASSSGAVVGIWLGTLMRQIRQLELRAALMAIVTRFLRSKDYPANLVIRTVPRMAPNNIMGGSSSSAMPAFCAHVAPPGAL